MEGNSVNLKTYQAYTMAHALTALKRDLGEDAVILNTRSFRRGGLLGIGRRTIVEVTAIPAKQARERSGVSEAPRLKPMAIPAQRAYSEARSTRSPQTGASAR